MPVLAHVVLIGPRENRTTAVETVPANDRVRQTLHQYVGDVPALQSNIEAALDAQLREARNHPAAAAAQSLSGTWRTQQGSPENTQKAA